MASLRAGDRSLVPSVSLRTLMWVRQACLGVVVVICLMGIEGHVYSIPAFYSLSGAAVLSLPTIAAAALSCAALLTQRALRGVTGTELMLWGLVIVVCSVTPATQILGKTFGEGQMGLNTGLSFACLAVGHMLFGRLRALPFVLTMGSMVLPFVGIVGHLFGQNVLFGAMSLQTSLVLVALGIASSARYARRPIVRPLLSGVGVSIMARRAIGVWISWIVFGAVLVRMVPTHLRDVSLFLFLAGSALMALAAILMLAMIADHRRRQRNRELRSLRAAIERDPITGLYYRGLGDLYLRSYARTAPVGMLMIGVDSWDNIVREGGRERAELILRRMSTVISGAVGCQDMVLRYDDRRFLVLLHGKVGAALAREADRLRVLVNQPNAAGTWMPEHSASIGTAVGRVGGFSLEPAVSAALAAVRSAERAQHGSVEVADATLPDDAASWPDQQISQSG